MPNIGMLPTWPLSPHKDDSPAIVVGEVHHPVKAIESRSPKWLTIPERGLYTGVAIFGAVGSGKTSACMRPFAQQILSWQARDPQLRAAGLVLEVKGDFCHDIRQILADTGREEDYIELGMEGRWQWNPLSSKWLDSPSPRLRDFTGPVLAVQGPLCRFAPCDFIRSAGNLWLLRQKPGGAGLTLIRNRDVGQVRKGNP